MFTLSFYHNSQLELIRAFEFVRDKIENDIQQASIKLRNTIFQPEMSNAASEQAFNQFNTILPALNDDLNVENPEGRIYKLSHNCIFGVDANPRMARTAKMNMIMHGDGHGGVHHHDGLLNVNGIFDGRFDVILTNPPFGARVDKNSEITKDDLPDQDHIEAYSKKYPDYEKIALTQLKEHLGRPIIEMFEVGKMSSLTEVLFLERCLNLLKPGGRMGIVLPDGVLNNPILQKVRDFIETKAKIINITSIPQDVFIASGATIKPSLVFLKKFDDEEAERYRTIRKVATDEIHLKFKSELDNLSATYESLRAQLKAEKDTSALKKLDKEEKEAKKKLDALIYDAIKDEVKKRFNYKISIVEVEKAGISSTGAEIENELDEVAVEFKRYRENQPLWETNIEKYHYDVDASGNLQKSALMKSN